MRSKESDTITALATAPYPAAVSVVRISGGDVKGVLQQLFTPATKVISQPRKVVLGTIAFSGEVIDSCLALFMPSPHSYTGEDTVEFHLHGNPILAQELLRVLGELNVRIAEPGEFTRRAFLNGRIDLTEAEAVGDLIAASSLRAARLANEQLHGRLNSIIDGVAEPLRDLIAEIEAGLDFPEEEIPLENRCAMTSRLDTASKELELLRNSYLYGATVKEGLRVLLAGPPNAGKSSLFNALLGEKRSIVTDIPGTTRDAIEAEANIDGYRLILCDSAGIKSSTTDKVEEIGIEIAKSKLEWADLILCVVDANIREVSDELIELFSKYREKCWIIQSKIDIAASPYLTNLTALATKTLQISVKTGEGLATLRKELIGAISGRLSSSSDCGSVLTSARHHSLISSAVKLLAEAKVQLSAGAPMEIVVVEIRSALSSLEELVGVTHTEDILGRIFSKFCIGK